MNFKNTAHAIIYKSYLINAPYRFSNRFLAATYILSASKDIWRRAKKAIIDKRICFDQIARDGLSDYDYAIFGLAQDIYERTERVNLYDLGDKYLISDKTFNLAINAIKIAREGYTAVGINKNFN